MMQGQPTLAEINEANRNFWDSVDKRMRRRMADRTLTLIALDLFEADAKRRTLREQSSFHVFLDDAERVRQRMQGELGRRGGKAPKIDPLQKLIERVVRRRPGIAAKELQSDLEARQDGDPIIEIRDGTIRFWNRNGSEKKAAVSGLKDRLSRAKKK